MISYSETSKDEELVQILDLQQANLPNQISEVEKNQEGFVTVSHDFELLKQMHEACAHTIALDQQKVVGYALSMHRQFGDRIAVLIPMFQQIDLLTPKFLENPHNYVVMGQVCIDKPYRKQGIFRGLYTHMKSRLIPPFEAIITEVAAQNQRSMEAHYAIGFERMSRYSSGGQDWELMLLR